MSITMTKRKNERARVERIDARAEKRLDQDREEIREIARLTQLQEKEGALARLTQLHKQQAALAEALRKEEPKDRAALERFRGFYESPDEMAAHILHDRQAVMTCAEPLGVSSEDIDVFLAAYAIALTMRARRARPPAPQYETAREFVLRVRREWQTKIDAAPESEAAFGQLPEPWEQLLTQFLHDSGTMREFVNMRDHVTPEQLELPGPWPSEEVFAAFSLRRQWEAGGGTIEELEALPKVDRERMLQAQMKGVLRL